MEMEKKKLSMEDCLPVEIIEEILTRLPIKPILRFRSVCKTWRSIIDSPHFCNFQCFILCPTYVKGKRDIYIVMNRDSSINVKTAKIPLPCADYWSFGSFLLGSCEGLFCLSSVLNYWKPSNKINYAMCIWNPETAECLKVPDISLSPSLYWLHVRVTSGFGIDPITKEFKVLLIFHCWDQDRHMCVPGVEPDIQLYTLGAKSWRRRMRHALTDVHIPSWLSSSGVFLNGSVHWIKFVSTSGLFEGIVSFDLGSERFGGIPNPKLKPGSRATIKLRVLEGWLCLLVADDDCYEIWVMKDYNVGTSWTKLFVIRKSIVDRVACIDAIFPVCIRMNGELVLLCNSGFLVSYDSETGKATILKHNSIPFPEYDDGYSAAHWEPCFDPISIQKQEAEPGRKTRVFFHLKAGFNNLF